MKYLLFSVLFFINAPIFSQDIGGAKVGLGNFVRRMYTVQPFDGVKLLQNQDGVDYLISLVALVKDPSKPESVQSRVASIKAKAFASQYLNGSTTKSEVIVVTTEQKTTDSTIIKTYLQETLKESSMGFVQGMELLINFDSTDGKQVIYVYYKEIIK